MRCVLSLILLLTLSFSVQAKERFLEMSPQRQALYLVYIGGNAFNDHCEVCSFEWGGDDAVKVIMPVMPDGVLQFTVSKEVVIETGEELLERYEERFKGFIEAGYDDDHPEVQSFLGVLSVSAVEIAAQKTVRASLAMR